MAVTSSVARTNQQQQRRTTAATRKSGDLWSSLPLAHRHAAADGDWRFKAVLAGDGCEQWCMLAITLLHASSLAGFGILVAELLMNIRRSREPTNRLGRNQSQTRLILTEKISMQTKLYLPDQTSQIDLS
nr:hypothetical protein Itr_chr13CG18150 [Ipomoea trifida]